MRFLNNRKKNQTNNDVKSMITSSSKNEHVILCMKAINNF